MKQTETTDYRHIIFLQGDDANGVLDVLDSFGVEKATEMLLEYDLCPDACRITDYSPAGESDRAVAVTTAHNQYELVVNEKIGYIGLCEILS